MGGSMLWRCAESLNLKWNQVVHAKNYFAGGMDDSFFFVAKMSYRSCETTCYSVLVLLHVAAAFGIDTRKYTQSVCWRQSKKRKQLSLSLIKTHFQVSLVVVNFASSACKTKALPLLQVRKVLSSFQVIHWKESSRFNLFLISFGCFSNCIHYLFIIKNELKGFIKKQWHQTTN